MFLDPGKLYAYFSSEFSLKKGSNGWFDFKCPICNELENRRKMAAHFKYRWVKCWVCGYNDSAINFIMDHEGVDIWDARARVENTSALGFNLNDLEDKDTTVIASLAMPHGFVSLSESKGSMGSRAGRYLERRGFNLKELDRLGFGYCNQIHEQENENFFGYIIIPFKSNGELVYYVGRDFLDRGEFGRYKNPKTELVNVGKSDLFFNEDALNIYGEVFLTEGWADASTMGRNGISSQGWSLSQKQRSKILTSACDRVVFLPDLGADNTGKTFYTKAIETAIDYIDYKEVAVVDLRPLQHLGKDANDMGKEAVLSLYRDTEPLTLTTAMSILLD